MPGEAGFAGCRAGTAGGGVLAAAGALAPVGDAGVTGVVCAVAGAARIVADTAAVTRPRLQLFMRGPRFRFASHPAASGAPAGLRARTGGGSPPTTRRRSATREPQPHPRRPPEPEAGPAGGGPG